MPKAFQHSPDIKVTVESQQNRVSIRFVMADGKSKVMILIKYPVAMQIEDTTLSCIKSLAVCFFAQLVYAPMTRLPVNEDAFPHASRMLDLLLRIRKYEDNLEPIVGHTSSIDNSVSILQSDDLPRYPERVINLVGGGKDSLYASFLLEKNGMEVVPVHIVGLNTEARVSEERAARNQFKDQLLVVTTTGFEELIKVACSYSSALGRQPGHNLIVRGRDLLTAAIALPLVKALGAAYIALNSERDLWRGTFKDNCGNLVPLHDTQDREVVVSMSRVIASFHPEVHLFSPIAGVHELRILQWLLQNNAEISNSYLASCFFGEWCGKCNKCLRYHLVQEFLGVRRIIFKRDPETAMPRLTRSLERAIIENRPHPYKRALSFLLATRLSENLPTRVQGREIDDEKSLFAEYEDELFPPGFVAFI